MPKALVYQFFCFTKIRLTVKFSSRRYLCARKNPYKLHPVSQNLSHVAFQTVPMFVWLWPSLVLSMKLVFFIPTSLSSRRSMVWCPWLCARRSLPQALQHFRSSEKQATIVQTGRHHWASLIIVMGSENFDCTLQRLAVYTLFLLLSKVHHPKTHCSLRVCCTC